MKFQLLFLFLLFHPVASIECGNWYSSDCVCDVDIRYCEEGDNGATDSLVEQHPLWQAFAGYFYVESYFFESGLFQPQARSFQQYGYFNTSISGSRVAWHRYYFEPPASPDVCEFMSDFILDSPGYECGFTGFALRYEGFGTSSYERDGSIVSTPSLVQIVGNAVGLGDEDDNYKWIPVDENTVYAAAKSDTFFMSETFVFTNNEKTEASSVTDLFLFVGDQSILFSSSRNIYHRLPDAQSFIDGVHAAQEEYNISNLTSLRENWKILP